jgi:uncharacterized protein
MTFSIYQASIPVFQARLAALDKIIAKATPYAAERKIDEQTLIMARLSPDMLPLWRQVTLTSDFAKGAAARLAGVDVPKFDDTEKTFADLHARIAKTLAFIATLKPEQFDGSDTREITMPVAGNTMTFTGDNYLLHMAMPNFYFHLTSAYAILRHNGLPIGKMDFMNR